MIRRSTYWIGGLAIGLGLWVMLWERRCDSTDQAALKAQFLTFWDENAVSKLRISGPAGEVEVERIAERWHLLRPVEDEADPEKLRQLVRLLCRLPLVEPLKEAEFAAEEFGFSKSNVIEVDLLAGTRLLGRISLGREGPFQKTAYASVLEMAGRQRGGLVRMEMREWLATPLAQLRDRRLLRVPAGLITQYRLKTGQGEIVLRREERKARWHIETPLQSRANDDIAYSLLEELTLMEAVEFRDDQALAGTASLDGKSAMFRLEKGPGTPLEITLRQEEDGEGIAYLLAKRSDRKAVLRIRDNLVQRLPRNVNQLRYPYLAEIPVQGVARIQIKSRSDPDVDLVHTGSEWKLSYLAELWPANTSRIEELLGALNAEPVLEFRSSAGAQSGSYGLDQPLATLSVTTSQVDAERLKTYRENLARKEGGAEVKAPPEAEVVTRTLRFGRGDDAFLNANYEGEPYIFAIDPALVLSHLPTHPLKWRGLRLFDFRPVEVREIGVSEVGGMDSVLYYNHLRNEWTGLVDGERIDEKINVRLAERLAYHLSSLAAVDWMTERRDALRALQRPGSLVRIRISRAAAGSGEEKEEAFALRLAPAVQEDRVSFYYGQFEGRPDVFLLSAENYERLIYPVLKQEL